MEKPKVWCVLNDGSQEFKDSVVRYINANSSKPFKWEGVWEFEFYGQTNNDDFRVFSNASAFNNNILTISQFKTIFMNENKKLIGYKCPFDMFSGRVKKGNIYRKATDNLGNDDYECANIIGCGNCYLPKEIVETWEAVYKEDEYKAGEWLFIENDGGSYLSHYEMKERYSDYTYNENVPDLVKFVEFWKLFNCEKVMIVEDGNGAIYCLDYSSEKYIDYIRKATQSEIESATKIFICGKEVEFDMCNESISICDIEYYKNELEALAKMMQRGQIKFLNVGCHGQNTVDLALIEKILKKLN